MKRRKNQKTSPSLGQIEARLRRSAEAVREQGVRERRQKASRQAAEECRSKFEVPLTEYQMKRMRAGRVQALELAIHKPGTVPLGTHSTGLFDRENSIYIVDGKTMHPQLSDGPFRRHRVAYVHNLQGEFLHRITYLERGAMRKMRARAKKGKGGWVELGGSWLGAFDGKCYRVRKVVERGKVVSSVDSTHNLRGREVKEGDIKKPAEGEK